MDPTHIFVDESKNKDYLLVAALTHHGNLADSRKQIKTLLLQGQERLHMKNERDSRRREILALISKLNIHITIYRAPTSAPKRHQIDARADALRQLIDDALAAGTRNLCLESDATMDARDRQVIAQHLRNKRANDALNYSHLPAKSELLLSIPDAVGWAWNRGGDWKRMVEPLVTEVVV